MSGLDAKELAVRFAYQCKPDFDRGTPIPWENAPEYKKEWLREYFDKFIEGIKREKEVAS